MFKASIHEPLYGDASERMTRDDQRKLAEACALIKRATILDDEAGIASAIAMVMEGLSKEAVEDIKDLIEEVIPIVDPEFAKIAQGLARGLGLALGAAPLIRSGLERSTRNQRMVASFKTMLQKQPHLKERPNEVAEAFQVISNYAPSLAVDPIASGHIVGNIVRLGHGAISPAMIKELIETEKAKTGDPQAQVMDFARSLIGMKD